MPGIPFQIPQFDAANVASKFPRPLQNVGGMALEGLKQLYGGSSTLMPGPQTTIGPGAIPLMDEAGYLRKVAGSAVDDLGSSIDFFRNKSAVPDAPSGHYYSQAPWVGPTQSAALSHPFVDHEVEASANEPGLGGKMIRSLDPDQIKEIVQALSDAYHKGMPFAMQNWPSGGSK